MGNESFGIYRWLYATLSTDLVINSLIGTRIYRGAMPLGTSENSIVIQNQEPLRDIRALGKIRIMVNGTYLIKAITTQNAASLEPIVNRVDDLLESASKVNPDITINSCVRERDYELTESRDQLIYSHCGAFYRIQAQIIT